MNKAILECKNISKSFGNFQVLKHVNFQVAEGDIYGFLGPNGAGKSTCIRIISDLLKADEGTVEIHGYRVDKNKEKALASTGMLIEKPAFYNHLSAERNLKILVDLLPDCSYKDIGRVLKFVDLEETAGRKVKHYSQGMKQRLGIAQALMGNPRLIILDEPINGLDPLSMKELRELFVRLRNEGLTILMSSHLLYEVERSCNRMCIINKGEIIQEGGVKALMYHSSVSKIEFVSDNHSGLKSILDAHFDSSLIETGEKGWVVKMKQSDILDMSEILRKNGIQLTYIIPRTNLEDYFIESVESKK